MLPKRRDPFLNHEYGSIIMKYLYFFLPAGMIFTCYFIWPNAKKITHGRRHIMRRLGSH